MAITKISGPARVGSHWTYHKVVEAVRSLIDETDSSKIYSTELREYINICVSYLANITAADIQQQHYGIVLQAQVDDNSFLPFVSFNTPVSSSVVKHDFLSTLALNVPVLTENVQPFTVNANINNLNNDLVTPETNIYGTNMSTLVYDGHVDQAFYKHHIVPSATIDKIVNVSISSKPITTDGYEGPGGHTLLPLPPISSLPPKFSRMLTKLSFDEIVHAKQQTNTLQDSGAWAMFAGRLYLYIGEYIVPINPLTYKYQDLLVDIFALRRPILDNLVPTDEEDSGVWQYIDLPNSHIRALILMVQKMGLEKLGKRIHTEAEQLLSSMLNSIANIPNMQDNLNKTDRQKVDQGFNSR